MHHVDACDELTERAATQTQLTGDVGVDGQLARGNKTQSGQLGDACLESGNLHGQAECRDSHLRMERAA